MIIQGLDYSGMKSLVSKNEFSGNVFYWTTVASGGQFGSAVWFISFDGQNYISVDGPAPSTILTDFPNAVNLPIDGLQLTHGAGVALTPLKADNSIGYDAFKAMVNSGLFPSGNVFYSIITDPPFSAAYTGICYISYDMRFAIWVAAPTSSSPSQTTIVNDFPGAVQLTMNSLDASRFVFINFVT